ncbi:FAD-binding domain-containing protein [Xylaria bambusicola]|uniref:FAD-binding domain-containing protein n=1 Tax=Xylaria bambusicola TaxID=326684 RepID=UPI002007AD6F|nr:FAD-binding domain-containing protein [Xylaria bambusicola]KAI0521296.1 FAD-binding domain-containing protein [Xylaria bambusicola]
MALTPPPALDDAGLLSQVLCPAEVAYEERVASYWSNTAKKRPTRILRPASAEELSRDLVTLVNARQLFAVRSGGHSMPEGASNIEDGVTIDLGLIDQIVFDKESETVQVGSGCLWNQVYGELQKHNRAVVGGRAGSVGVGGFLLGGGNAWLTAQRGWACDNIVAAEVVLADGKIVSANRSDHADLLQVLKGGGNNFGIVTRFTLTTVPLDQVWAGILVTPKDTIPKICRMTMDFVTKIKQNTENNLIIVIGYQPDLKDVTAIVLVVNTAGVTDDPIFDEWKELPRITEMIKTTSLYDLSFEATLPKDHYTSWFTLTFKSDPRIMLKASELHDELVASLKSFMPDGDFMSQCTFQPLPMIIAQQSLRAGGNIMGVEDNKSDGILFQVIVIMKTEEQHAFAYAQAKGYVESLKEFAQSIEGGLFRWLYMNYADKSQDVLTSYGPENVKKMREAANHYDPDGVFQKLCPGGWKLPELDD